VSGGRQLSLGILNVQGSSRTSALVVGVIVAVGLAGCAATANVTADELAAVVERDGVPFDGLSIPDVVVDRLGEHKVVLLGETHHLREHWAVVAELLSELHDDGFRLLLIESAQMAGWLWDDYVQDGGLAPDWWEPPPFWERRLAPIRAFNETLPPAERIHVRGIDVNEDWSGGARDFETILGWVGDRMPTRGPIDTFSELDYALAPSDEQTDTIEALLAALEEDRLSLVAAWGAVWYDEVAEMLEVELASIDIRAKDGVAASKAREEIIKQLADDAIAECSCGTLINIGGHHAQKSHLMGTKQEWMGDYLAHASDVVGGSIIVVGFASARTELEPGAGGTPWDILESSSPENELYRIMAETWPGETVFLPLDDPLFKDRRVAYNSEDVVYATPLKEQYDAIIQYGIAHRMPEN
jgi:hypothetical protein